MKLVRNEKGFKSNDLKPFLFFVPRIGLAVALGASLILGLPRGAYPKAPAPAALGFLRLFAFVSKLTPLPNAKNPSAFAEGFFVPRIGFEPTRGFPRCDLNTVR